MRAPGIVAVAALLVFSSLGPLATGPVRAEEEPKDCKWDASGGPFEKILDPRSYPWYPECENDVARAGNPYCTAPWARHTYNPARYNAYHVGGGAAFYGSPPDKLRGEPRYVEEGTFGVDYDPPWSRVRQQWFHGTRYQEGEGKYETDRKNNPFKRYFSGR